jgi:hypothetical protein
MAGNFAPINAGESIAFGQTSASGASDRAEMPCFQALFAPGEQKKREKSITSPRALPPWSAENPEISVI